MENGPGEGKGERMNPFLKEATEYVQGVFFAETERARRRLGEDIGEPISDAAMALALQEILVILMRKIAIQNEELSKKTSQIMAATWRRKGR